MISRDDTKPVSIDESFCEKIVNQVFASVGTEASKYLSPVFKSFIELRSAHKLWTKFHETLTIQRGNLLISTFYCFCGFVIEVGCLTPNID